MESFGSLRDSSTDILCDVESFGSPRDSSTDIWDSVWCGKLRVIAWFVNRHFVSCGKLRVTACFVNRHLRFCVMWKTSGHRVIRQQTFCVMWKTDLHRTFMLDPLILIWINFLIIDQCLNFKSSKNISNNISIDTLLRRLHGQFLFFLYNKTIIYNIYDYMIIWLYVDVKLRSPSRTPLRAHTIHPHRWVYTF